MLPCHSCYIYGTWRSKAVGSCKVIVWRKAEGGKSQSQMRGVGGGGGWCTFYGAVHPSVILSKLTTYFSLLRRSLKRVL